MSEMAVDPQLLEACVRDVLNVTAPRRLVVLEPLKVTITNFPHAAAIDVEALDFPEKPERGKYSVKFSSVVYIERSDFRKVCNFSHQIFKFFVNFKTSMIYIFEDFTVLTIYLVSKIPSRYRLIDWYNILIDWLIDWF